MDSISMLALVRSDRNSEWLRDRVTFYLSMEACLVNEAPA